MNRSEWIEQAACREYEVTSTDDPWYAEGNGNEVRAQHRIALEICNGTEGQPGCPVRDQCLADALATEGRTQAFGIRGGMLAADRAKIASPRPPVKAPARCGTASGYSRHRRLKEKACEACLQASADRTARYKAERRARLGEAASA